MTETRLTLRQFVAKYSTGKGILRHTQKETFPLPVGRTKGGDVNGRPAWLFREAELVAYYNTWQESQRQHAEKQIPYWIRILQNCGYTVTKETP